MPTPGNAQELPTGGRRDFAHIFLHVCIGCMEITCSLFAVALFVPPVLMSVFV